MRILTNSSGEVLLENGNALTYEGGSIDVNPLTVTENGTYTAPEDTAYSPVTVNVPTGPAKTSSDLVVENNTVSVPAGLYSQTASASVSLGEAGTPIAAKGSVINHSIEVTPSVTNTTGYINGSTKIGTAVSISASELVSGSQTTTSNGTFDVTNLATMVVNVESGTPRTEADVTVSGRTVSIPNGLYSADVIKKVAEGTAGTPSATKSTVSNHSISITPTVTNTTGYINGSTINGSSITVSASELVSGNKTLTPDVSAQSGIDVTDYASVSVNAMPAGVIGTLSASKSISGNIATITPALAAGTAGYNVMAAATGTATTVSAAELVSGKLSITNINEVNVVNYATAQIVDANLVASNIAKDVVVLGITGTHSSEKPSQSKTATANGTVYPDSGYVLSSVTVAVPTYSGGVI